MNTRLKQFLAAENISQSQFADTIKVVRASVSHVLSGRNNPSYEFMRAIMLSYPQLNMEWLMFGKGKMYKDHVQNPPKRESTLLFDDFDLPENDMKEQAPDDIISVPLAAVTENIESSSKMEDSAKALQQPVKQRNVKKILILFDDGTFQEM